MKTLFNGQNLQVWVVMSGGEWTVEQDVLVARKGTNWNTNPEKAGSWLSSEKECGDFILELEYAINTDGNSGFSFFRIWTTIRPTLDTKGKSSLIMAARQQPSDRLVV